MILKEKIGVVGNGFVGGAVKFGFSPQVGCDAEVRVIRKLGRTICTSNR